MVTFSDVLITVIFLLVLALPGYVFAKTKMLPKSASEVLSVIVLYGCQPVIIITSFQNCAFSADVCLNMLIVLGLATLIHIAFFIGLKFAFAKSDDADRVRIIKYASVFSNCGFMGLPFLQSLFSESGMQSEILIYCAVIIVVFNVFNWTFGVYILTKDKKEVSLKKVLLNPVIIAVFVGLASFFILQKPLVELAAAGTTGHKILSKLSASLNYISNMVTPLSMIVIGIRLANVNFKQLFMDKWAYLSVAIKLLAFPLAAIFTVAYLPVASTIKYTVFFLLAMPSATSSVMMAVKFGKDSDFATVCVLLSTLLSVITLPLLYLFMNEVLKVPL